MSSDVAEGGTEISPVDVRRGTGLPKGWEQSDMGTV